MPWVPSRAVPGYFERELATRSLERPPVESTATESALNVSRSVKQFSQRSFESRFPELSWHRGRRESAVRHDRILRLRTLKEREEDDRYFALD